MTTSLNSFLRVPSQYMNRKLRLKIKIRSNLFEFECIMFMGSGRGGSILTSNF